VKGTSTKQIRNVAFAGHAGCGKTSLAELILNKSGETSRLGTVQQGTTVADYRDEEKDRSCSIYSSPLHCAWKDHHLFFIDTPGYADFWGEAKAALNVVDAAVIVVDAATGIEMGTVRGWREAKDNGLPRAFFVNGLDREQADFAGVLASIQETYGATVCIPFTFPVGEKAALSKVVDVLRESDMPGDIADTVEQYRESLMDTIAESSEELMTKYLEGEELTEEEIAQGLHAAIRNAAVVPVFAGSVERDIGIEELMNGIVNLFPSPVDDRKVALTEGEAECTESGDLLAFVFKSVNDPFIGQLTYLRVYSGQLSSDSELVNLTTGGKERFGAILLVNGKEQSGTDSAGPGEIVAVPKLKNAHIGDTFASRAGGSSVAPTQFPKPTMSYAVYAAKKGEDEKISSGLARYIEEDPTLRLERNAETRETVLSGLGDQHLQNIINRLTALVKVEVDLRAPKVPYRETITAVGSAQYRHKKQTGGHGQFAEVHLRLEPSTEADFAFDNEVVGGNIPRNFIPAVEKGVVEAMQRGPLADCKVMNVRAVVFDGKHHPVDSSEMAFKIAARGAFRDAMRDAKAQLLEPIMTLKIMFPEEYMGDISGDLSSRRGRILGMGHEEGLQVVNAEAPLVEVFSYATQLRSITQGRGTFEMDFERYDPVPANIAQQIQAEAAKAREEE